MVIRLLALMIFTAMMAVLPGGERPPAAPVVRFEVPADHPERWFVELAGGVDRCARDLTVYAVPAGATSTEGLPPLLGRYEKTADSIRFAPQFAPAPGVTYIAHAAGVLGVSEARFTLPAETPAARTRVTAIYPTIDRVPANLLKLYVEFSAPMRDGDAEKHLHLLDARGRELPRAFLHVDAELWNDTHTRLTVLFDPGRIKRGLRRNLEEGAPLSEGQTARLVVDAQWRDAHGAPLAAGFDKPLTVGPADRTSPDWRRFTVIAPSAGTRDPVTVRFDEPLDRALLDRWIAVADASGVRVAGRASVGPNQTSWSFVPTTTWRGDRYQVLLDPRLEDLAGNSLTSPFDADIAAHPRDDSRTTIVLFFSTRPMT
jgi:hypothetical protein